jgi:hypothetical protein
VSILACITSNSGRKLNGSVLRFRAHSGREQVQQ